MLTIQVDDHPPQETMRETGLTVRAAVIRAFGRASVTMPSLSEGDDVRVNGKPSSYGRMLDSSENNALIRIITNRYQKHIDKQALFI